MPESKLKIVRKALKLNQKDFAAMLGIQQSYYSALELGKKMMTGSILETLFDKIGVNPSWYYSSNGAIFKDKDAGDAWGSAGGNSSKNDESIKDGIPRAEPVFVNGSDDRLKSLEQQSIIAEKAIQELLLADKEYQLFRECIFEITSFPNIIDNLKYSSKINALIKAEDVAKHYRPASSTELKALIKADFNQFEPYIPVFLHLTNAIRAFREKAKQISIEISGIDPAEYE